MSLVATSGAANANAYADAATAQAYAETRVGSAAFLALNDDQQEQALITAASEMDTLEAVPGFLGTRYSTTQALAFPRGATATLPVNLVRANIELAMSYAAAVVAGTDPLSADVGNGNIKEDTVGPITTVYFAPGAVGATAVERFPAFVQRLLYALLIQPAASGWGSAEVSRGS